MPTTQHVTDLLHDQHRHIQTLFDRVMEAPNRTRRQEAFEELRRFIAVHETAKELVIHPVARRGVDGETVVDHRVAEEEEIVARLAELDDLDVEDPEFNSHLSQLRVTVSQHAEYEEREEFPLLRAVADHDEQILMARAFQAVEAVAPTRPHPGGPEGTASQLLVGTVASVIDRTKDAITKVLRA